MQTKTVGSILAIGLAAALIPAGCKSAAPEKGKIVVGFVQEGDESGWRTAETKSVKDEAAKRSDKIDLKFYDAQQKTENEITGIRNFIAQGVDVIIFCPKVKTGWDPVLREAAQKHIPVILADRNITTSDPNLYATFVGSDFVQEGVHIGDWLATKMNGKGNIVEIEGQTGSDPAIDRKRGFDEEIAKHPDMHIIASVSGDFDRTKGKEAMEAQLKAHPGQIQAVFAHNDEMALGCIQAIKEAGLKPGKDILVVSIDGQKNAFQAMVDGELSCDAECNPLLGPSLMDAVEAIHAGQTEPKWIKSKEGVWDQSTAAAELPKRQY